MKSGTLRLLVKSFSEAPSSYMYSMAYILNKLINKIS